jgi:hypothetical protein
MGQIHGSGTGNWANTAVVDGEGRLWVTSPDGVELKAPGQISGTYVSLGLHDLRRQSAEELLSEILKQQKITNLHLAILTENKIDREDI